jgi:hypothetical protein
MLLATESQNASNQKCDNELFSHENLYSLPLMEKRWPI